MIVNETAKLENAGHVPGQLLRVAELVQPRGVGVALLGIAGSRQRAHEWLIGGGLGPPRVRSQGVDQRRIGP